MSTADLIGWIGALSGGFMTAIQYVRARRVGVDGISPLTWSLFLMMGIFWMTYGLEEHSACMVVSAYSFTPESAIVCHCGATDGVASHGTRFLFVGHDGS